MDKLTTQVEPLSFFRRDFEARVGFRSSGATDVNAWLSGLIAAALTAITYTVLYVLPTNYVTLMFIERGPTQHAAVFLGFWCATILTIKHKKLRLQSMALTRDITPHSNNFVLSSQTADQIIEKIHENADDPERFMVYQRILTAISNLKNLGRVSDVDEILKSLAERDENVHETSFGLLNGFLWAIPVLGFIGTVLGLSVSISNFSGLLDSKNRMSDIVDSLKEVTAGLSTAFETTLVALVIALVLQLWMTVQKNAEERFLDDSQDYCFRQVVNRLRILPYEESREV